MTNKGYGKQRRAAYCNFEFAANQRFLPSTVADEPASDRRRSKLSVVSVQISLENTNPHFLDADGRNYQSHDISMPCDSAY